MKLSDKSWIKFGLRLLIGLLVIGDLAVGIKALGGLSGQFDLGCLPIPGVSGCAIVKIPSVDLSADFYNGDELVATGVNSVNIVVVPEQIVRINIRNVKEASPDSSESYVYKDTSVDVQVAAGQSQTYTITPPKIYHQGSLRLTCDILSAEIGTDISCQPIVDGTAQPKMKQGMTSTYTLNPGKHTLRIELSGADAAMWYPSANDRSVDIAAGAVAEVAATFNKLTLLTVALDQPGVVGDLYLDGNLIGEQVASAQAWVQPDSTHQIKGTNFSDPKAQDLYSWGEVGISVGLRQEQQKTVRLPLQKQDLVGLANISCQLVGWKPPQSVQCLITVDDSDTVEQVEPGKSVEIALKPGTYNLTVKLTGNDASKWLAPSPHKISIQTGQTTDMMFVAGPVPTPQPGLAGPGSAPGSASAPSLYKATLSGFGANARAIFAQGQALKRDPHRFSKVGDCETDSPFFLIPFDDGLYNLGNYTYLKSIVPYFAGSFKYQSQAGRGSFVVASVLDPTWADPNICQAGETPLACEYRTHNPAFALIMLRTFPYPWEGAPREKYIDDMRSVISYTIDQGIVPVVSTIPLIETSPNELQDMNAIIRQLAADYQIPLWDFYATTSTLPNNGVKNSHLTVPPIGATFFNDEDSLQYGMPRRNLETLQVLYSLYANVIR